MPTVVSSHYHESPVQVLILCNEDVWLYPWSPISVPSQVQVVGNDQGHKVTFQRISVNAEELSLQAKSPSRQE